MQHRLMILAVTAALAAAVTKPATAQQTAAAAPRRALPSDSSAIARKYIDWLYTSRFDSLLAHMPADSGRPSIADMEGQWANIVGRAGTENSLVAERWVMRNGRRQYWRVAQFSDFTDEPVVVRLVILPDGMLGGIGVNPESRTPPIDPEP